MASSFRTDLVEAGVKLYEHPAMAHAKLFLIDNDATVGSTNLTRRALLWDRELNVQLRGQQFVDQLEQRFREDFAQARPIELPEATSMWRRAIDVVADAVGFRY
jgi:phosphatidylserine/phosphatidylglycerophosphate/cardiolipin synthase-like enzyme